MDCLLSKSKEQGAKSKGKKGSGGRVQGSGFGVQGSGGEGVVEVALEEGD